jgi:L-rhamnose isomerase
VIGTRVMIKALLIALLEPTETLCGFEQEMNFTARLALLEELKTLPFGAVWNYYCAQQNVPTAGSWMNTVTQYEKEVLSQRG